jgi:uncharacterized protein YyaL (SSP411 family)
MSHLRRLVAAVLSSTLLAAGGAGPASADYRAKAGQAIAFIQEQFYDTQAGLYRPAAPIDPKALPYDFMWGNGVQFSALVAAARHQPDKYRPLLSAFASGLKRYWDEAAPLPGFDAYFASPTADDKYYDDNAWLVLGFLEAYDVTRDAMFLDWARRTQRFVLSGWDERLGGGIYWRQDKKSKNTCANAPAATAALRLYQVGGDADQLRWARRICTWTNAKLQDSDGLFWDNIDLTGQIERTKWTYNTALMIRTNLLLYRVTKERSALTEARRLAAAAIRRWVNPQSGVMADTARFNHLLSEALLELYETTREINTLNTVRRHADFGWRYGRDPRGGYWDDWTKRLHAPDERKTLIENAATARLLWLLAPYPDVEELRASGEAAARRGEWSRAANLFRQALDSTAEIPRPPSTRSQAKD